VIPAGDDRVTTTHRAKLAYVYVRQSTAGQVRQHQESTELQYRLVDRAVLLGWPRERVRVIDEDLGRSGASSDARQGFQRLIAEIGLGKAGLVLSLDASRLARNNRDWHQLLELCSLFGVILADGERLYDPSAYHDRLLLGLGRSVPFIGPSSDLVLPVGVTFLDRSLEFVVVPFDHHQVVVRKRTPLFLEFTFKLVPFTFEMIGVHVSPPFDYYVTGFRCPYYQHRSFPG